MRPKYKKMYLKAREDLAKEIDRASSMEEELYKLRNALIVFAELYVVPRMMEGETKVKHHEYTALEAYYEVHARYCSDQPNAFTALFWRGKPVTLEE